MTTLDALLARVGDPARPLLTLDDRATGERVELSATTTANWVAKTANLLVDELDLEPGGRVRLGLPSHWLRWVWVLSTWAAGGVVVARDADVGLSGPDLVGDEEHRLAASLRPLGARFVTPPEGFVDLAAVVPGQSDHFTAFDPPTPDSPALDLAPDTAPARTHAEVLAAATPDDRRLVVQPGDLARDVDLLVAALLGGGSLVLVVGADRPTLEHVAEQERGHLVN